MRFPSSLFHVGLALTLALPAAAQSRTYTTDADFDEGVLERVNHLIPDQLQLDLESLELGFLYVACSGRNTICRIDSQSGAVLGEYSTAPDGLPKNPSGIAVDDFGNVWTGNRDENALGTAGSVAQIGIVVGGTRTDAAGNPDPSGQYLKPPFLYSTCVDRDGDGLIRTSRGGGDVLAWPDITDGQGGPGGTPALVEDSLDECILVYQRLDCPNVHHLSIDAAGDVWVGGYPGVPSCFRKLSGLDGSFQSGDVFFPLCGGFSGLIDASGTLWSSSFAEGQVLRADALGSGSPNLSCTAVFPNPAGVARDPLGGVWVAGGDRVARLDPTGAVVIDRLVAPGAGMLGIAVAADGSVWAAASLLDRVFRLDAAGSVVAEIPVGSTPTGVAVDASGKVWVVDQGSDDCRRIDPATNAIDLVVPLPAGSAPFTLGNFARTLPVQSTAPTGSWTVVYDSGAAGTRWGTASWTSEEPAGARIEVAVRASESPGGLASQSFLPVANGVPFAGLAGRFIEIRADFTKSASTDQSPVLFDLTISGEPAGPDECVAEDRRAPGSLLLFPEFASDPGRFTVLTVTNTDCAGSDVDVEFRYIDGESCQEFNRRERLSACDTLTLVAGAHDPNQTRGFAYVYALDPATGVPSVHDHLIGQALVVDGIESFEYAMNAVAFGGIGDGMHTDLDGDGLRDLDGLEYTQAPDEILIPRFFGQQPGGPGSELVLVGLSGGQRFAMTIDLLVYNDNEEAFSGEYTFQCWDKVPLEAVSGVFGQGFLANATADDPAEVVGAPGFETGWIRIDGALAQSSTTTIADPAFYAVLVDRVTIVGAADLPFEFCSQPNGKLLPRTNDGER